MMGSCVVVGVDDSTAATQALRWAADEAHRHDFSLLIVNVPSPGGEDASRRLLTRCSQTASFRQPTVPVSTMSAEGVPSTVLATLSADAALVVMGARGGDQTEKALGSVAARTASHAHTPVIIVPESIDAEAENGTHHVVAVGLSSDPAGLNAFHTALLEARNRGSVVHAIAAGTDDPRMPAELAEIAARFDDVTVQYIARPEDPVQALSAVAGHADVLVLGCHHLDEPWGHRLGPIAASLVGQIAAPTMVVSAAAETAELRS